MSRSVSSLSGLNSFSRNIESLIEFRAEPKGVLEMLWQPRGNLSRLRNTLLIAALVGVGYSTCAEAAPDGTAPAQPANKPAQLVADSKSKESGFDSAIRARADEYVQSFAKGDAKALAALWTPDGVFIDQKGREYAGRDQIESVFKDYFQKNKARGFSLNISSIKSLGEKAAIEKGTSSVKDESGKVLSSAPYTVVHVNINGVWEMASVVEHGSGPVASVRQNNPLDDLRWLSGEWTAQGSGGDASLSAKWMADRRFLVARFIVKDKSGEQHEDLQVIGVDPRRGAVISWLFDSEGGSGRAFWSKGAKGWVVETMRFSPEGRRMSSCNVLEQSDTDSFTWRSTNRVVDGAKIPDSEPITVKRINVN